MVEFSNIFIIFSYLRAWLASLGLDLGQDANIILAVLGVLAAGCGIASIFVKNKSDANTYNMKRFFYLAAAALAGLCAFLALYNYWPGIMAYVSKQTGLSARLWSNATIVGMGGVALAVLAASIGRSPKDPNNSSLMNRRQSLSSLLAVLAFFLALFIFYEISAGAFTAGMAVLMFVTELISILFWFYDPFVFTISRLFTFKPSTTCKPTPNRLNRFAVIGCAHNEESVITQLVESLYATTYPKNSYDIYVICDNCTDKTADMVRKAGAIAMERHDPDHRGKGFGVQWMFDHLNQWREQGNTYDAYIILDADNLVNESFFDEINYKMNEGYEILQAYLGCKNPTDTWISKCYSYAYWVSDEMYQDAHSRAGLTAQMGGTGMVLRPSVLDEIGWHTDSLTEDLVLTARYVLEKNQACCWVREAKLYDEKPLKLKPSVRQRTRWMQGHMDAMFRYAPKLFVASIKNHSLKQFDMAFYLARPLINLILVATYTTRLFFNIFMPTSPLSSAFIMGTNTSTLLLISTVLLQAYLLFNEYYARYIHWFLIQMVFTFTWYPAIFRGLIKRNEKYWISTVHTRNLTISEVREDAILQEAKERLRNMDNIHRMPLGQILLKAAVITRSQLNQALRLQKEKGGFLGDIIVENNAISPEILDAYLTIQQEMKDTAQNSEDEAGSAPRLGELLAQAGLVTPEQLGQALDFQKRNNCLLGEALIATHVLPLELLKSFLDVQKVLDMHYVTGDSAKHIINGLIGARSENLGTILYSGGLISAQQLKMALDEQLISRKHIGRTLVDLGFLSPHALEVILEFQADGRFYLKNKEEMDEFLSTEGTS